MVKMRELWSEIPDFDVDLEKLAAFYHTLKERPHTERPGITNRREKNSAYGWALTSRSGSNDFGVTYVKKSNRNGADLTAATDNCFGYAKDLIFELALKGYFLSRARILVVGAKSEMLWHTDDETCRLHIPIYTNRSALFQWKIGGKTVENHFPANGKAYIVNVALPHRVVNGSNKTRVHFVSSLRSTPKSNALFIRSGRNVLLPKNNLS